MKEAELRKHRCCFTGHRPEKLNLRECEIKAELEKQILASEKEGFRVFISGMSRGVDIWAAEVVLKLKSVGYNFRLICAIPYRGFEQKWNDEWKERYYAVLRAADLVKYINPSYTKTCFHSRNEWMVNHSARVIAVYNGKNGGTKNTIEFAKGKAVDVVLIYDLINTGYA